MPEMTIPFKKVTSELYFREAVAEGEYNGATFMLDTTVGSKSPLIEIDGELYIVDISDIVKAVLDFHFAQIAQGGNDNA